MLVEINTEFNIGDTVTCVDRFDHIRGNGKIDGAIIKNNKLYYELIEHDLDGVHNYKTEWPANQCEKV